MKDFVKLDSRVTADHLGFIPMWLEESNPRPAREQLDAGYSFAGGWQPFKGFTLGQDSLSLSYPGDPPLKPLAYTILHKEKIVMYPHAWVAIIQPDNSFEVCRMD